MSVEFETALRAWEASSSGASEEELDQRARTYTLLIRAIADGRSVSPAELAAELGIPGESAEEVFAGLQASGMEFDEAGNLVGAALTPRPTPHRVSFGGKELFAWCALDTLFIPGLLDRAADVRSLCAATGEEIRLRITPRGVETFEPPGAVLSVVLPGIGCSLEETGPESPT